MANKTPQKSWWSDLLALPTAASRKRLPGPGSFPSTLTHTPRFRPMKCGPGAKTKRAGSNTCYDVRMLMAIRNAYNQHQSDPQKRIHASSPKVVLNALRSRMADQCDQEECWLKLLPPQKRQYIAKHIFAPKQPKEWLRNSREWLSNYDICNVLRQYEEAYPEFEFLGPSSIDFDERLPSKSGCVWNELCRFQLANYKSKHTKKIGVVLNLDEHTKGGSHWVALYLDLEHHLVFYLDSALNDVPEEVETFVQRVVDQGDKLGMCMRFRKNRIQHQFSNTECGMYCLFFLITLITERWGGQGRPVNVLAALNKFESVRIPDAVVMKFRERYYNPPDTTG